MSRLESPGNCWFVDRFFLRWKIQVTSLKRTAGGSRKRSGYSCFWLQKIPKTSISRPPGWPHASKRSPTSHGGHFGGTAAGELPCVATKTRLFLVFFFLRLKSRLFFKQFRVYLEGHFGMFFQMFKTQKLFKKRGVHVTNVDSNCVFFWNTGPWTVSKLPTGSYGVQAVGHIHQQGMLHRDIKPDNLVMRRHLGEFRRSREK